MTNGDAIKKINLLKMVAVKKGTDTEKAVDMAIEALKQPERKWIPVRERLPEEDGIYLVSGGGYVPWIAELWTFKKGVRAWSSREHMEEVEVWMPLPEPPKKGEQK